MTAVIARRVRRGGRPWVLLSRSLVGGAGAACAALVIGGFWAGWAIGRRAPAPPEPQRIVLVVQRPVGAAAPERAPVRTRPVAIAIPTATTASIAAATATPTPTPTPSVTPVASAAPTRAVETVRELDVRRSAPSGGFGLQVGAFATEAEALDFLAAHADAIHGVTVFVIPTELAGRGTWYRVRIGQARTKAAAETLRKALGPVLAERAIVVAHK